MLFVNGVDDGFRIRNGKTKTTFQRLVQLICGSKALILSLGNINQFNMIVSNNLIIILTKCL